jgi:hypothetical protein
MSKPSGNSMVEIFDPYPGFGTPNRVRVFTDVKKVYLNSASVNMTGWEPNVPYYPAIDGGDSNPAVLPAGWISAPLPADKVVPACAKPYGLSFQLHDFVQARIPFPRRKNFRRLPG